MADDIWKSTTADTWADTAADSWASSSSSSRSSSSSSSAGADYSDITLWAGFETGGLALEESICNQGTATAWSLIGSAVIEDTSPLVSGSGHYLRFDQAAGDGANLAVTSGDYFNAEKGAVVFLFSISSYVNTSALFNISSNIDATDSFVIKVDAGGQMQAIWVIDDATDAITEYTSDCDVRSGTFYAVATYDSTANTMSITVFTTSGVQVGTAGTYSGSMNPIPGLANSVITIGDAWYTSNFGKIDKLVLFDGSVARTAQEYCDIVRLYTGCPYGEILSSSSSSRSSSSSSSRSSSSSSSSKSSSSSSSRSSSSSSKSSSSSSSKSSSSSSSRSSSSSSATPTYQDSYVFSFNTGTGIVGTTIPVSGFGFTPKFAILFWSGTASATTTFGSGHVRRGIGFIGDVATERGCVTNYQQDASGTVDCGCAQATDCCVISLTAGGSYPGSIDGRVDIQTIDTDGYTFIIDEQFANNLRVTGIAFGGVDITDAATGIFTTATSEGDITTRQPGFKPDLVFLLGTRSTTWPTAIADGVITFGFFDSSGNQGVLAAGVNDRTSAGAVQSIRYISTSHCYYFTQATVVTTPSGYGRYNAMVDGPPAGFQVYHESGGTGYGLLYLAVKGGNWKVGSLNTRTDGNDITVSSLGFTPEGILFASHGTTASTGTTAQDHDIITIGAAAGISNREAQATCQQDAVTTSEGSRGINTGAVYIRPDMADGIEGLMDIKSIDSGGFTCVMDTTDPTAALVLYITGGRTASSSSSSRSSSSSSSSSRSSSSSSSSRSSSSSSSKSSSSSSSSSSKSSSSSSSRSSSSSSSSSKSSSSSSSRSSSSSSSSRSSSSSSSQPALSSSSSSRSSSSSSSSRSSSSSSSRSSSSSSSSRSSSSSSSSRSSSSSSSRSSSSSSSRSSSSSSSRSSSSSSSSKSSSSSSSKSSSSSSSRSSSSSSSRSSSSSSSSRSSSSSSAAKDHFVSTATDIWKDTAYDFWESSSSSSSSQTPLSSSSSSRSSSSSSSSRSSSSSSSKSSSSSSSSSSRSSSSSSSRSSSSSSSKSSSSSSSSRSSSSSSSSKSSSSSSSSRSSSSSSSSKSSSSSSSKSSSSSSSRSSSSSSKSSSSSSSSRSSSSSSSKSSSSSSSSESSSSSFGKGWTWGEQFPEDHIAEAWTTWTYEGTTSTVQNSGAWNAMQLFSGQKAVSPVKDLTNTDIKNISLTWNEYVYPPVSPGSFSLQWRGRDTIFSQDSAADGIVGPVWEEYPAGGGNKTWKYIQIKVTAL